MWTSQIIETYQTHFDFSSSEQGKRVYTGMKIGESDFFNLIENVELSEDFSFQSILCDHCGFSGCASGNWLTLRKFNEFIFFIPYFKGMEDQAMGSEYDPPYYLKTKGSFFITLTQFETFKKSIPDFNKILEVPTLTKSEILKLYKWDVPQKMFGEYPNFGEFKSHRITASSELFNLEVADIVSQKIEELENSTTFNLNFLENPARVVTLFLDDYKTTQWKALFKEETNFGLLLGGIFKIQT